MNYFCILGLLVTAALGNRLVGSADWKRELGKIHPALGTRITAFVAVFFAFVGLSFSELGFSYKALLLSLSLIVWYALERQRSPRGSFFALHDRNGEPAERYDGKLSRLSQWLAEISSGLKFKHIIQTQGDGNLRTFGRWYGFWHWQWVAIPFFVLWTIFFFKYCFVLYPLMMLHGEIHNIAGKFGFWKKEEGGRERAEIMVGLFMVGLFSLLLILGSARFGGLLVL